MSQAWLACNCPSSMDMDHGALEPTAFCLNQVSHSCRGRAVRSPRRWRWSRGSPALGPWHVAADLSLRLGVRTRMFGLGATTL